MTVMASFVADGRRSLTEEEEESCDDIAEFHSLTAYWVGPTQKETLLRKLNFSV